ncbi:hypothetical protein G0U57_019069 [Chelydra serpentina]|uniref:Uncharacterized protein n=1 Tax=Chelydra serpentina TaxID=8475 RepID=A0A8T1SX83_CHESE|nr:hypothetical protein G0U57_019069 [Chelydra serpentina]
MKCRNSDIQARILVLNPRASFMPGDCHSLNLIVSDAASSSLDSVSFFGVLQKIYILLLASTMRWKILMDNITNLTVKLLSYIRWESHTDSIRPVSYQVTEVYDALMELVQSSKAEAGIRYNAQNLANQITDFKFLVSVVIWHDILFQIRSCLDFIVAYRDNGFEDVIIAAKEMAENLGVEPVFKETCVHPKKRQFGYEGRDEVMGSSEKKPQERVVLLVC